MNERILYQIFDPAVLESQPEEWGVIIHCQTPTSIGFATTLTPDVIKQAISKNIDLLVTHHDAWDFMLEERDASHELLEKHEISHIWCHAPLDAADFGTAAALLSVIGCTITNKIVDNYGRVGDLPYKMALSNLIDVLETRISERPCRMYDAKRPISRIASVPGGGMRVDYLAEAITCGIDLYITGETSLYLLEFARFRDISLLIYSHNYTEMFGTQNLATKVAEQLEIKEVTRLEEPHF